MRLALIQAREARGWSQQKLADLIQKDRTAITKYERGKGDIPGTVLRQLSVLLDVPMDILLRKESDVRNTEPISSK